MLVNCIFVGLGGFVGAVLRYLCNEGGRLLCGAGTTSAAANAASSTAAATVFGAPIPILVTLGINIIGSFAIMFIGAALGRIMPLDSTLMLFLRVGLCGGFTTFSTFSAEALGLFHQGQAVAAIAYALLSCVLCIAAAFAGEYAGGLTAR